MCRGALLRCLASINYYACKIFVFRNRKILIENFCLSYFIFYSSKTRKPLIICRTAGPPGIPLNVTRGDLLLFAGVVVPPAVATPRCLDVFHGVSRR